MNYRGGGLMGVQGTEHGNIHKDGKRQDILLSIRSGEKDGEEVTNGTSLELFTRFSKARRN